VFPIAYISSLFPLRSETFVWREVRELRRRGWTVHTFSLHPHSEQTPDELIDLRDSTRTIYWPSTGTRVAAGVAHPLVMTRAGLDMVWPGEITALRDRPKLIAQAVAGASMATELRRLGVRHVHAHFAHAPASVAMYAARAAGLSFSFTGHANDLFHRRLLLKRKLSRAAFVSSISSWHCDLYQAVHRRSPVDYPVVRCGVDTDFFSAAHSTRPDSNGSRVLTLCRLVEKKGVDTLIRAAHRLRQMKIDLQITIAGDGPLRAGLTEMTREFGLNNSIRFVGPVDSMNVPALMREHDLFVLPCRVDSAGDRDGIPVVLMEAMACGMPVVAGDLPAIRELVRDGQTGILIDGGSVDDTALGICRLLNNPDLRRTLADAGRQIVLREFSLATNVDRLESEFLRCVGNTP
jgi:colanic acid/amylovoran biosynthesis glycosyltransferase